MRESERDMSFLGMLLYFCSGRMGWSSLGLLLVDGEEVPPCRFVPVKGLSSSDDSQLESEGAVMNSVP